MPFYLGAFLAVALEWRSQARNAVLQAQTLQALETKATTLEEEMRTLGRQNEAYQTSLKQTQESKAETERKLAEALGLQADFYLSIGLGVFNRREHLLDSHFSAHISQLLTGELGSVVRYQAPGYPKATHDVSPHKMLYLMRSDLCHGLCLYPLSEVFDGDDQILHLPDC